MIKPSKLIYIIFLSSIMIVLMYQKSYSGTSITVVPNGATGLTSSDFDLSEMTDQIQHTLDLNGPYVANAFALANLMGYPIGKSYLGSFPHFEIGFSIGAGCSNMGYFDKNNSASDNGTVAVIAPNPVIHFGIGLGGGFDILGRFFMMNKTIIDEFKTMDYNTSVADIQKFSIYSTGATIRYNYIEKKTFLPFYFAFGGLTLSLGGNFIYGDFKLTKKYNYTFNDIDINGVGIIDVPFDGTFTSNVHWAIFTIDARAIAYFDILYIFSLYTGFGVAGNIGYFKLEVDGSGDLTSSEPSPYDELGSLSFTSSNKYYSTPVIPTYIIGIELNIFSFKIDFQTMVNLYNRSDVNAEIGTRIQF